MCAYRMVAMPNSLITLNFGTARGAEMVCITVAVNFCRFRFLVEVLF